MTIQDTYKYNSVDVAKYIVAYANKHKYTINMTKIQKLLYIAYGVYLSVRNERLTDEHPQAWPYGPVFPTTRNRLLKLELQSIDFENQDVAKYISDETLSSLMVLVFDTFGKNNAVALSDWSHKPGSPWDRTKNTDGFKWGNVIPDRFIKDYFDTIIVKKENE